MSDKIVFILLLVLSPIPSGFLLCDHLFNQKKKSNRNWLNLLNFDAGKNTWKQSVVRD